MWDSFLCVCVCYAFSLTLRFVMTMVGCQFGIENRGNIVFFFFFEFTSDFNLCMGRARVIILKVMVKQWRMCRRCCWFCPWCTIITRNTIISYKHWMYLILSEILMNSTLIVVNLKIYSVTNIVFDNIYWYIYRILMLFLRKSSLKQMLLEKELSPFLIFIFIKFKINKLYIYPRTTISTIYFRIDLSILHI